MHRTLAIAIIAAAAAPALALAGCSAPAPAADDSRILIVAATDVYADVAQTIGGDLVTTQAVISGTASDPHSYEATTRDQLAVADADLIIVNGGGYDTFMETLIEAATATAPVITAVEVAGVADGGNEHVWYDLGAMEQIADEIERQLTAIDPDGAATFAANADAFTAELDALQDRQAAFAAAHGGLEVIVTEPVPLSLLSAMGYVDVTPSAFTEAVEEGSEIPVSVLDDVLGLVGGSSVRLLGYNDQTTSPETERVLAAAETAGVPVVGFAETLPDGQDYVSWMTANLDAVEATVS